MPHVGTLGDLLALLPCSVVPCERDEEHCGAEGLKNRLLFSLFCWHLSSECLLQQPLWMLLQSHKQVSYCHKVSVAYEIEGVRIVTTLLKLPSHFRAYFFLHIHFKNVSCDVALWRLGIWNV